MEKALFGRGYQAYTLDGDNVRQGLSADLGFSAADRERIRARHPAFFNEIFINAPLEVCEARDKKGLYRRARAGEVKEFTGISAPYEPPLAPDLEIRTDRSEVEACVAQLVEYVERKLRRPTAEGDARRGVEPDGR